MCGWWSMRIDCRECLQHIQGGGVLLVHPKVPATCTTVPNVHLRTQPCSDLRPAYGTCVAAKEDEEVAGVDSALWQVFEKSPQHMKDFSIWLCYACSGTDKMHRESVGSDHRWCLHSATETRAPSTMSMLAPSRVKAEETAAVRCR